MNNTFPLAPMSPVIKGLTIALLLLPIFLAILGIISQQQQLIWICLLLIILYGIIWLWCRPCCFIVSGSYLKIKFPAWCRSIPISDISQIRVINQQTFNQEMGWAIRIGVGGLWGGFGWLWTSRKGLLEFYVSRTDNLVLIERLTGSNLLLTPSNYREMIEMIHRQ